MITKTQAESLTYRDTILQIANGSPGNTFLLNGRVYQTFDLSTPELLPKPKTWRVNGKIKTWKRDPERFQLPIKYGLKTCDYLTNENAYLFELEQ